MRVLPFFKPKKGWHVAGTNLEPDSGGGGGSYVLPVASADTLGGVKIGEGVSIDANGVLSVSGGGGGGDGLVISTTETKVGSFLGSDLYCKVITPNSNLDTSYKVVWDYGSNRVNPVIGFAIGGNGENGLAMASVNLSQHVGRTEIYCRLCDSGFSTVSDYFDKVVLFYTKGA